MLHRGGVDADDPAAHRVDRRLVVPHDDQLQLPRDGRQHAPLTGDYPVDDDQLGLQHVLQVGHLLVEPVIVIDEPVPVVLEPDVVLHRERHRGPRVGLELGHVDEEVRLRHRLGHEDRVAQAALVGEGDLYLHLLIEERSLHPHALQHGVEAGVFEDVARRDSDAAALADHQLRSASIDSPTRLRTVSTS